MKDKQSNQHAGSKKKILHRIKQLDKQNRGCEAACKSLREDGITCEQLKSVACFSGGIAHAYNNLLMAIIGNISLAQLHLNKDHKASHAINEAYRASIQAKDLTRKLILLAQAAS